MNKFNLPRRNIQKERRQKRAERKKQQSKSRAAPAANDSSLPESSAADGSTTALALKVSSSSQHVPYMSGKRRAKLQKKWRRAQKEAIQSGLVTMEDIEMMTGEAEGEHSADGSLAPAKPMKKAKFSMKKRAKLRLKSSGPSQAPVEDSAVDAMVQ